MKSRVWSVNHSVTCHCCFNESVVLFNESVTEEECNRHIDYSIEMSDRIGAQTLFETLEISDECLGNLVTWLRGVYDGI